MQKTDPTAELIHKNYQLFTADVAENVIFTNDISYEAKAAGATKNSKNKRDYGLQLRQLYDFIQKLDEQGKWNVALEMKVVESNPSDDEINRICEVFKANLKNPDNAIIVNYDRLTLDRSREKGGGHVSTIDAYDPETKSFLINDVNATEKPVWVKTRDLVLAMATKDTDENRGYITVAKAPY